MNTFKDKESDIRYTDQDFELNEVKKWFSEMDKKVNHVTTHYGMEEEST